METTGLIFIPDISGFTRFVKAVEIEHSRLIIRELLEILIDANDSGLIVSEIEGDAILFFKFGARPPLNDLYTQVTKMFTTFHKSLVDYESRKYCQCNACLSAIDLSLKVITHYGEFAEYQVKNFNKLIGKDVILAHQLLKNDINLHEYWLVTDDLLSDEKLPDTGENSSWVHGQKTAEDNRIHFCYTQLGYLKRGIAIDPPSKPDLNDRTSVFTLTQEYATDIITLLHGAADFTNRNQWMQGVKRVEIQNHFLPRIGMRCTMWLENGTTSVLANHYLFHENEIEFSEVDEPTGHLYYYKLVKLSDHKTRLTLNLYVNGGQIAGILFKIGPQRKLQTRMAMSLQSLAEWCETASKVIAD